MSDEKLRLALEALDKLSPQLNTMARKLNEQAANPSKVKDGDVPSQGAAWRLVIQALPGLQRAFAGRCTNVADLSIQTRNGFGDTEDHVTQLIQSVTGLSRGGHG
ncbi:Uncharacterised protein [Mycobacteroides abscessus subsp. massiliense]|uniref:hypothetical protein n=1 Tax=Mycobacteroides abscessus TaxID=36809 RepID=UPI0009A7196C|nr:hypothetical protein [Mycobacteroides abscessus]SKG10803.1 Uncharacterised protein [Mycobacteroides abscessus subsp. massiliense]SKG95281.1 Uncharacterised protein [Mycobacteroides abscessus subsp. massiliense]SKH77054.1 Uncharacterised protein [Mycobacteroides abscessus subsp. massiliense]SKI58676.1 Uncharacterised protein [Mycobacteroides abscessus subsp. massiliense]SKI71409.1 Uncharacterised protein [Mycobacteroides abscessus subsp. massiliense]